MNYKESKINIDSSTEETPSLLRNETPSLLTALRSRLETFTAHDIPFFLMPVRLETRFMQVKRNLLEEAYAEDVKTGLDRIRAFNTQLDGLKHFRGFGKVNIWAVLEELEGDAIRIADTFNGGWIAALSKSASSYVKNLLRETEKGVDALRIGVNTYSNESEDAYEDVFGRIIDNINHTVGVLNQQDTFSEEWKEAVDEGLKPLIEDEIQKLENIIKEYEGEPVAQIEDYLKEASDTVRTLFSSFGPALSSQNKEYIIELLHPLFGKHAKILEEFIYQFGGEDRYISIYRVYKVLQDGIKRILVGGLDTQPERIMPPNQRLGPVLKTANRGDIGQDIEKAGEKIELNKVEMRSFLRLLGTKGEGIPDPNTLSDEFLNRVLGIATTVRELKATNKEKEADYLFDKLKEVDTLINDYIHKAKGSELAPDVKYIEEIDKAGYQIGYNLNQFAEIGPERVNKIEFIINYKALWIRAYPDDIFINSHEKKLKAAEEQSGKDYWQVWASSNGDPAIQLKAWQALAATYGPERAAWIAKATTPSNIEDIISGFSYVFQASPQVKELTRYTVQLNKVGQGENGQIILSDAHWNIFVPSVESIGSKVERIAQLPQEEYGKLRLSFNELMGNFGELSNNARKISKEESGSSGEEGGAEPAKPPAGENPENPPPSEGPSEAGKFDLEKTIGDIKAKLEEVDLKIEGIERIEHWNQGPSLSFLEEIELNDSQTFSAPFSNVLPDRFLFAGIDKYMPLIANTATDDPVADPLFGSYQFKHVKIGNRIPAKLLTGIDPVNGTYSRNTLGQLQIDPQIRWMFDFPEAVRVGMAVEMIFASEKTFDAGFDVLLALGMKLGEANQVGDSAELTALGKTLLEDLLDNHHYSPGGLSVLEIGTPTNNTEEGSTPMGGEDREHLESFATEVNAPLFYNTGERNPLLRTDGQLLAEALGIDHSVFQHIKNAGGKQIAHGIAMNRALYNGTIGNYMRDVMKWLFTKRNVSHTKEYFTDYVLGRGALPSIRIGKQPYGILPTSSLGRWEWKRNFYGKLSGKQYEANGNGAAIMTSFITPEYDLLMDGVRNNPTDKKDYFDDRFHIRMDAVFESLNKTWENIVNWHVKTVDKESKDPQKDFVEILGLEPTMAEAYSKIFVNNKTFRRRRVNYYSNVDGEFGEGRSVYSDREIYPPTYDNNIHSDRGIPRINIFADKFLNLFNSYRYDMSVHYKYNSDDPSAIPVAFDSYGPPDPDYEAHRIHPTLGDNVRKEDLEMGIMDSIEFINEDRIYNRTLPYGLFYASKDADNIVKINEGATDVEALTRNLNVFNVNFIQNNFGLYGPSVMENESSYTTLPMYKNGNYIQWLSTATLEEIWNNNQFRIMPSRSLLFLLLRQSTLNTYKETALDLFEEDQAFRKLTRNLIGSPEGTVQSNINSPILTKWHLLFNPISAIDQTVYKNFANQAADSHSPFKYSDVINASAIAYYLQNIDSYNANPKLDIKPIPAWLNIKLSDYLQGRRDATQPEQVLILDNLIEKSETNLLSDIALLKGALNSLATCTVSELNKLMREHIDLCSYRLDAWNLGKVNKRLWEQRRTDQTLPEVPRQTGIYLGAYGWVFDVRHKGETGIQCVDAAHLPSKLTNNPGDVYFDPENLGLIQTPSMTHALAAALLRAGYDSEKHTKDNRFAINLTSERMGKAFKLINGMQGNQTLSALLGYELERGLHESFNTTSVLTGLDAVIYEIRRNFSLVDATNTAGVGGGTAENLRANMVIDAISLMGAIKNHFAPVFEQNPTSTLFELYAAGAIPFDSISSSPVSIASILSTAPSAPVLAPASTAFTSLTTDARDVLVKELDNIVDYVDALGDLAVAEGVFQIARGNLDKAASVLETWGEGRTPSNPGILQTPKNGVQLSNKLAIALDVAAPANLWSPIPLTIRAIAEPLLNAWIAQILKEYGEKAGIPYVPSATACKVSYKDGNGNTQDRLVLLEELNLQPLDLIQMVERENFSEEFAKRIRHLVRLKEALPLTTGIQIDYATKTLNTTNPAVKHLSFSEINSILISIKDLLSTARPMSTADFMSANSLALNTLSVSEFDIAHLSNRISGTTGIKGILDKLINDINLIQQALATANNPALNTTPEYMRRKLLEASLFGISFAVPESAIEVTSSNTTEDVWRLLLSAKETLLEKQSKAQVLIAETNGLSGKELKEKLVQVIQSILGDKFFVITPFSLDTYQGLRATMQFQSAPTPANDLLRHHQSSNNANAVEEMIDDWLFGLARVQNAAGHIETLRLLTTDDQNSASSILSEMRPFQFPYQLPTSAAQVADYWLGAEYPEDYSPKEDKSSIAIFDYQNLNLGQSTYCCGLIVDSWEEIIPHKELTTGITFNYDQPSAKPPQSVLLAINPQVIQDLDPDAPLDKQWRLEDLLHTLLDTIDLGKMRMVEPDSFRRATAEDRNPYTGNDAIERSVDIPAEEGTYDPQYGRPNVGYYKEADNTAYFEMFKWILPAVVGEITPMRGDPEKGPMEYTGTDSVQQVSFDYNPNNDIIPPGNGSHTIPDVPNTMRNWENLNAQEFLASKPLQTFLTEEETLSDLANTHNSLLKQL